MPGERPIVGAADSAKFAALEPQRIPRSAPHHCHTFDQDIREPQFSQYRRRSLWHTVRPVVRAKRFSAARYGVLQRLARILVSNFLHDETRTLVPTTSRSGISNSQSALAPGASR
jgi:hypothetical protein